jgi:hypothetical protein
MANMQNDYKIWAEVEKWAHICDDSFSLLGIRFGLESAIGAIPVVGDLLGTPMALVVYLYCCKIHGGLSMDIQTRMLLNIVILGLIPFFGDTVDALFKCNKRNTNLLKKHLDKKYHTTQVA